jgi:RNA polymerase sigma factor (sigma-70 family)
MIDACRRGDHRAQCEMYRMCWRMIYPAVYDILRNREEAEDVLQESLIKGFEKLNELRDEHKYPAWQRRISTHMALNRLKVLNRSETLFDEEIEDVEDEDELPEMELNAQQIVKSIDRLPEGYRLIIRLHLLEDWSHEEISESLGIQPGSSRSQYARALSKLRKELMQLHERKI